MIYITQIIYKTTNFRFLLSKSVILIDVLSTMLLYNFHLNSQKR